MDEQEVNEIEENRLVKSFTAAGGFIGLAAGSELLMSDMPPPVLVQCATLAFCLGAGGLCGHYMGIAKEYGIQKANGFFEFFALGKHYDPPAP
jgi:hypothetical protein